MTVRVAKEEDFQVLVELGEEFSKQLAYMPESFEYNGEDVRDLLEALDEEEDAITLLYEDEKGIQGMIGAAITPLYFDHNTKIVSEFFFYITPKSRKEGKGSVLMDELITWAKGRGATGATMSAIKLDAPTNANETFLKYNFKEFETVYRANI